MPLHREDFPRARAVAAGFEIATTTESTNADLVSAAVRDGELPHLSVLLTDDQRAGRGRLGRVWSAPAGASLAISVLVRVGALSPALFGWLPLAAGLAMTDAVRGRGPRQEPTLKWPNDVLIEGRKVCGILAEVVPGVAGSVVIGAGVNTRMTDAELPVPTATSLALTGADVDLDALVHDFLVGLRDALAGLVSVGDADAAGVRGRVRAACSTLDRPVEVSLPDGAVLRGRAVDVDASGMLVVDVDGDLRAVAAGDVIHVR